MDVFHQKKKKGVDGCRNDVVNAQCSETGNIKVEIDERGGVEFCDRERVSVGIK